MGLVTRSRRTVMPTSCGASCWASSDARPRPWPRSNRRKDSRAIATRRCRSAGASSGSPAQRPNDRSAEVFADRLPVVLVPALGEMLLLVLGKRLVVEDQTGLVALRA